MSDSPDLTLPSKATEMVEYHDRPMQLLPSALYTLVDLTSEELTQLQQACESGIGCDPGTKIQFPPHHTYISRPLRAVFDYHIELGREGDFDPKYFIVATKQDWKAEGVLLVTLDDDDLECNVDSFRCRAETAGLSLVNLQVGNTSWGDEKDGYKIGDKDDDETSDEVDYEQRSDRGSEDTAGKIAAPKHGVPPKTPPTGFFIGVYAQSETEGTALIRRIEPAASVKSADEFCCRLQSDSSFANLSVEDAITQACRHHQYRTQQTLHLHPNLFLLSSSQDTQEDAIVLVHLDWSGSPDGFSKEELFDIGSKAPRKTQRLEISPMTTVGMVCDIASGRRKWGPDHWMFGAYTVSYPDCDIKIAQLIDKRWSRRGHGEDRVGVGSTIPESLENTGVIGRMTEHDGVVVPLKGQVGGGESIQIPIEEGFYAAFIKAHTTLAYRYRFHTNFSKSYCIVAATMKPETHGVLLIKIDSENDLGGKTDDGRKARSDDLVRRWKEVISLLVCVKVDVAYTYLSEVVDGKIQWKGVRLEALLE